MSIERTESGTASASEILLQVWGCWRQNWLQIVRQVWPRILPRQCQLSTAMFGDAEIVVTRPDVSPIRIPLAEQLDGRSPVASLRDAAAGLSRIAAVVAEGAVLRTQMKLPKARANVLRKALMFELPRLTPIAPERLYFDFTTRAGAAKTEICADLRVVQRVVVDDAVLKCRAAGLAVAEVRCGADDRPADWRAFPVDRGAFLIAQWQRLGSAALAAASFLLFGLLLLAVYIRGAATLSDLAGKIEAARAHAISVERLEAELRKLSGQETFLASEKRKPLFISTLAELSRALPDDTWISHLQMTGNKVRIQGYSRSASHLIADLVASDRLANPRFEAPLTSDAGNSQRFDLSLEVAP